MFVSKWRLLAVTLVVLTAGLSGCGESDDAATQAASDEQTASEDSTPEPAIMATETDDGVLPSASEGPEAGTSEFVDPPPAADIQGCTDSTCVASQAIRYEHESKGELTVVLYADFKDDEAGECRIAIQEVSGTTAQILPLEYVTAWHADDSSALADIFHFQDPAHDATGGLFIHSPDTDGIFVDSLRPISSGYFELLDLSQVGESVNPGAADELESSIDWGELDENGNYTIVVGGVVGYWNGSEYAAK